MKLKVTNTNKNRDRDKAGYHFPAGKTVILNDVSKMEHFRIRVHRDLEAVVIGGEVENTEAENTEPDTPEEEPEAEDNEQEEADTEPEPTEPEPGTTANDEVITERRAELEGQSIDKLREIASGLQIKYYAQKNKETLIQEIIEAENEGKEAKDE